MDSKINLNLLLFLMLFWITAAPAFAAEEIIISAAASLTNVMTEISETFEMHHPDISVTCNFASSGSLVQQMANGAPVDVFASASVNHMDRAESKGLIDSSTKKVFAANQLVLIVPEQSDVSINRILDLQGKEFQKIAVGHPESVPAGRYAKRFLEGNNMWGILYGRLVYTNSVRQVLDYVRRGETDAGFVYKTDTVIAKDKVKTKLAADKSLNILYPIAVTRMTKNPSAAHKFCEFVHGMTGQKILSEHGFGKSE